jgi:predicted ArsR family transcriptional regulator
MNRALAALFGSQTAAQVLLFMQNYGEGYAGRIASTFDAPYTGIRRQLERMEAEGILESREIGRTRVFTWNLRNPTVRNLREFLEAELAGLSEQIIRRYFRQRQRPRRAGKAL